jgi:hypothetical protein
VVVGVPATVRFENGLLKINHADNFALLRKKNRALNEKKHFSCSFKISDNSSAHDILCLIDEAKKQIQAHLAIVYTNINLNWCAQLDNTLLNDHEVFVELVLTRKMHMLIREGSFTQKLKYIILVGLRPEITRQNEFLEIQEFMWLQGQIKKIGIPNHFENGMGVKRIHAVHPYYIRYDDEVREELKVTQAIHSSDNPLFVSSHNSLCYALEMCELGATLVINGHWAHGKATMYGVWDLASAEVMAQNIAQVINLYPGKIAHINLLGCESGALDPELKNTKCKNQLFFKYEEKPEKSQREMAEFRNRAIFISEHGESIFATNSLAFLLLLKLNDPTIAVSAPPSLDYPFPVKDSRFNIGSDSSMWKIQQHYWKASAHEQETYRLLRETKSITQINASVMNTHSKRPWRLR